jgi:hypothetical protein
MKNKILILAILAMALMATPAMAITVNGTANGEAVSSSADFAFSTGQVTITLNNLLPGIQDVGQAISDFGFVLSNTTAAATLGTNTGVERTVNGDKTFTDGSSVTTGWALTSGVNFATFNTLYSTTSGTAGTGYYLNVLGTAIAPEHLIISPADADNDYDNANGSIAGNDPHNPFLVGPVSFTLSIPGVTSQTTASFVLFSYGTEPAPPGVPIPPSALLLGSGLLGLLGLRRLRKQ